MEWPKVIEIKPERDHKLTIIFLHGLGDTGEGWKSALEGELSVDGVKYILPTAQCMPVTINLGMRMTAWYDIYGFDPNAKEDAETIRKSANYVHKLIEDEEKNGISSENIIVGGFSQGGAIALYAGLTCPKKLGGIIGMSCYLPLRDDIAGKLTANKDIPVIMCHGHADSIVHYPLGQQSSLLIKNYTSNMTFKTYTGLGHSACPDELKDVKKFIESRLSSDP